MLDRQIISIKDFGGLDWRGTDRLMGDAVSKVIQSETPFDNALESMNLMHLKKGGIRTRDGFEIYINASDLTVPFTVNGQVVQFWKISNLNGAVQADRWLILTYNTVSGNGFLYDTGSDGVATTNPVLTLAGMKYAYVVNAFGRMYISPWEGLSTPLGDGAGGGANNVIYLYNGLYNVRKAAGFEPVVGAFAAAAAAGGNCTPGIHFCTVLYETDSGFITKAPAAHALTPLSVTTTAVNATISFTNIPTGPAGAGITKRHLIVTKIVVNNNGQGLEGYEPFFGVTLDDNTTTVVTFTKPDSSLVESAKTYFTGPVNNDIIRTYVAMAPYGTRMMYLGSRNSGTLQGMNNHIAVSPPNRPEQIGTAVVGQGHDSVSATLVGAGYSGKVQTGLEIDNTFYMFKGDSTFSILDNPDQDPVEWPVNLVDGGKGSFPFAIASITDNPSSLVNDGAIVVGNHGISFFNGRHSPVDITDNIWDQFTFDSLQDAGWSQIVIDPVRKVAFWKLSDPLFNWKTFCYAIDFKNGFGPGQVKFGKIGDILFTVQGRFHWLALREGYTAGTVGPTNVFDVHYPLLVLAYTTGTASGVANTMYLLSEASVDADGLTTNPSVSRAINWEWESGYSPNEGGELYQFSAIRLRGVTRWNTTVNTPGANEVIAEFGILDDDSFVAIADNIILGNQYTNDLPKKYVTRKMNAKKEMIRIRLTGQNRTFLQQLALFGNKIAEDRPR